MDPSPCLAWVFEGPSRTPCKCRGAPASACHRHGCARSHCTRGLELTLPHRHAELGGLGMLHRFLAVDAITIPKA
jgi:hypothetical protein